MNIGNKIFEATFFRFTGNGFTETSSIILRASGRLNNTLFVIINPCYSCIQESQIHKGSFDSEDVIKCEDFNLSFKFVDVKFQDNANGLNVVVK